MGSAAFKRNLIHTCDIQKPTESRSTTGECGLSLLVGHACQLDLHSLGGQRFLVEPGLFSSPLVVRLEPQARAKGLHRIQVVDG